MMADPVDAAGARRVDQPIALGPRPTAAPFRQAGGMGDDGMEVLQGGVGNAGAVVRIGEHVLRPTNPHSPAIHALLDHVRRSGFDGVQELVAVEPDGRERLVFIAGEVPIPPYPTWSLTDSALASIAVLMRRFHDASVGFVAPAGATWSDEMADPAPGWAPVICHNDVCPENVVFRDGIAVALLDFDFAAPGRREHDLASMARMCVPVDADDAAALSGRGGLDPVARLRVVADAYGLDRAGRVALVEGLAEGIERGGEFVRRRVEAGEAAFIEMWESMGGQERFDRRRRWFAANRNRFDATMA
jgi:hypothetical protein